MWPIQNGESTPNGVWTGRKQDKNENLSFSRSSLIVTSLPDVILARPPSPQPTPISSLGHSCELSMVAGVHKFTSRTSVGVLDWSCCSLALFPALILASCWYCWPCCRLAASTRSICSWQALRQSCNEKFCILFCIYTLTEQHLFVSVFYINLEDRYTVDPHKIIFLVVCRVGGIKQKMGMGPQEEPNTSECVEQEVL